MSCYLLAVLICMTLTHSMESSGIRSLETEYEISPAERRNENMMDYLVRINRGYGKPEHTFGRMARNEAFQTSPLIRFGKRYVMNDGRSEVLARLFQQYPQ
ncbi:putative FMRFamide-like neuropeptide [Dirofilaria immitis]